MWTETSLMVIQENDKIHKNLESTMTDLKTSKSKLDQHPVKNLYRHENTIKTNMDTKPIPKIHIIHCNSWIFRAHK